MAAMADGTTLIRLRIDAMVGSLSKKKKKIRGKHDIFADFLRTAGDRHGFYLSNINVIIIILTLSIWSENIDIEMQVRDRQANEHQALKQLGGDFTGRKKGVALFNGPCLKKLTWSILENQT